MVVELRKGGCEESFNKMPTGRSTEVEDDIESVTHIIT